LKNKHNKQELAKILSMFNFGSDVTLQSKVDGGFNHDEADVTIVAYLLQIAEKEKVIRILSDDTDIFILLLYWTWKAELHQTCTVQMEKWDGTVLNINQSCMRLQDKCLLLLGMHALSGCDTVSYPFGKGKKSAVKAILSHDLDGLDDVLGEEGATQEDLLKVGSSFFLHYMACQMVLQ
jgi:hypothetical protein